MGDATIWREVLRGTAELDVRPWPVRATCIREKAAGVKTNVTSTPVMTARIEIIPYQQEALSKTTCPFQERSAALPQLLLKSLRIYEAVENCQKNDFEIERQTPVTHVINIELDSMWDRSVAPAQTVDLGPAGDTTLDVVAAHVPRDFLAKLLHKEGELGARADYAHIAL